MTLGEQFAHALVARDEDRLQELLHPQVNFRAMTPNFVWEDLLEALPEWFNDDETLDLVNLESDRFSDTERVGYRWRSTDAKGTTLVEQQAYLTERDGRIGWLRIMCTGHRPPE